MGPAVMAYASADGLSGGRVLSEGALKYAYATPDDFAPVRGEKWGFEAKQPQPPEAPVSVVETSEPAQTTTAIKAGEPALDPVPGGNLWLRAAMLTPSVSGELTVTQFGPTDQRTVRDLLYKPTDAVAMSFSNQPSLQTDRFTGSAVVFLSKTTFVHVRTASLQLPLAR
jgi:hypothetical protein